MIWYVCFFSSLIILIASVVGSAAFSRSGSKNLPIRSSLHVLFGGVMISSILIFMPIYMDICANRDMRASEALLLSLHNVFRLFVMDGEMGFIMDNIVSIPSGLFTPYFFLSAILFLTAPLLTVSFVLSFFKNLTARIRLRIRIRAPLYIFSEMNVRSLTLAQDVLTHDPKSTIVFGDVFDQDDESGYDMLSAAQKLHAICLKEDVTALPFKQHKKNSRICVFIIGSDESENLGQSICLIEKYGGYRNLEMYVFCEQVESEMLLSGQVNVNARVRRINVTQSYIQHSLYTEGQQLFEQAIPNDEYKLISVVIVGLGAFGTELLRTLTWFCQMDGYRLEIHAFDPDPRAEERFALLCPELIDPAHNGNFTDDGEAQYAITIRGGVPADGTALYHSIREIEYVSAVFVTLDSDSENISVSARLCACFEQRRMHPAIRAVVRSSEKRILCWAP